MIDRDTAAADYRRALILALIELQQLPHPATDPEALVDRLGRLAEALALAVRDRHGADLPRARELLDQLPGPQAIRWTGGS
jgi:hypothetical protein